MRLICVATLLVFSIASSTLAQVLAATRGQAATSPPPETALEAQNLQGVGPAYLDQVVDPTEYQVGPGDKLLINVWGGHPEQIPVTVTPEATIIIPLIGEVSIKGMRLDVAKAEALKRMREFYPRTELSITLTEVRRFRVTVTGAVEKPGLYVVTANSRASEVLEAAKLKDNAAVRQIRLERKDTTTTVDLAAFERLGLRESNPYLAEGDILVVPPANDRWGTVEVSGSVKVPGRFGYAAGDLVGDLIELAYGLTPDADTTRLELWRFAPAENEAHRVAWPAGTTYSQWRKILALPDDRLIVRSLEDYRPKRSVVLSGEFRRPGVYVFNGESISLRAAVDSAGGFTPMADLSHALIVRGQVPAWSQEIRNRVSVLPPELRSQSETDWLLADALSVPGRVATDFVRLFAAGDEAYNISLVDRDQVVVPRLTESVNVIGRVIQPGLVPHRAGADLAYYLDRVGGYSWQADRGGTFLVRGATGAAVRKGKIAQITSGDMIVVPTKRGKKWWSSFRDTLTVASSLATLYLVVNQATR